MRVPLPGPVSADGKTADHPEITLGVLAAIERDSAVTQRGIASELGIALGLTNAYLKRCVKKGWIKIREAPRNRYLYYLTAQGFSEKSRLTAEYLSQSFRFFRAARSQCSALFVNCRERGWKNMALAGRSDLAEVAILCAQAEGVPLAAVLDDAAVSRPGHSFLGLPIVSIDEVSRFEAVVLTELNAPQQVYDRLASLLPRERILAPEFLRIVTTSGANGQANRTEG